MENNTALLQGILRELQSANKFDLTRQGLTQRVRLTLVAGEIRELNFSFRSLTITLLTGDTTGVLLSLGQNNGDVSSAIFQGFSFKTPRPDIFVDKIVLQNTNAGPVTIEFFVGFGDVEDSRLNLAGTITVQGAVRTFSGTLMSQGAHVVGNGTPNSLIASATTRRRITVKALRTNTVDVFIGTTGMNASNAMPLSPGEAITFDCNAALATVTTAPAQEVRWITESD
jgi:hypothetical protein